jgi:hypothetical protein
MIASFCSSSSLGIAQNPTLTQPGFLLPNVGSGKQADFKNQFLNVSFL